MNTEATTYLRHDHQRILALLDVLDAPPGPGPSTVEDRRARAVELVTVESQHRSVEEQLFWPAVRRVLDDGDRLADDALSHGAKATDLLQTIENAEAGSAEFEEALTAFSSAERDRIAFEEQQVWPEFRSAIAVEESRQLGKLIQGFHR
ncbi:hemerythrin domain-containing protein [Gordonia sp. HY285]|uniref:hemerythrin domain-containing protein n=1 Tax=Gordonia liuliyuniae TaxID=2911517 RepID=UPI001F469863|nr:hemerythrin domain-containing protein [Gordonia liuliyuniae]MCF8610525.1 hemerythrin domain-containing protein [Gordonia liuliyuniae]